MFKIKTGKLYGGYVHPWGIEYTEKNVKIKTIFNKSSDLGIVKLVKPFLPTL